MCHEWELLLRSRSAKLFNRKIGLGTDEHRPKVRTDRGSIAATMGRLESLPSRLCTPARDANRNTIPNEYLDEALARRQHERHTAAMYG